MSKNIMLVEDDMELGIALKETLELAGFSVRLSDNGSDALINMSENLPDIIISDINMPVMDGVRFMTKVNIDHPDIPVILITAYGTIEQAVEAMRYGAVDYLVKPFEAEVLINTVIQNLPEKYNGNVIAHDAESLRLFKLAKKVARSDASILISGESGTGKEVLARFIHDSSPRCDKSFIAINCAAIPENMLEATLFGYEKGAFTGAYKSSPGKFEIANGGTLLLDEVTEMPLELQAKLLRVIQEREVERIGGNKSIELDIRIISTTNRNMADYVREKSFREDLYYRLNVFPIEIPSLRHRHDDIIPLAEMFVSSIASKNSTPAPTLSENAKALLVSHQWPGNIRELENTMQRAMILHAGKSINAEDIMISEDVGNGANNTNVMRGFTVVNDDCLDSEVRSHEWDVILNTIRMLNGNRKQTAEKLGISPRTLRYKLAKMRKAGIHVPEINNAEYA